MFILLLLSIFCNAAESPAQKTQSFKFYKYFLEQPTKFSDLELWTPVSDQYLNQLSKFSDHVDQAFSLLNKTCKAENLFDITKLKICLNFAVLQQERCMTVSQLMHTNATYFSYVQPYLCAEWKALNEQEQNTFTKDLLEKYETHTFEYSKALKENSAAKNKSTLQTLKKFAVHYAMVDVLHSLTDERAYKFEPCDDEEENIACCIQ